MSRSWFNSAPQTLADYTAPELIVPQLKGQSAESILAELSSMLTQQGRVSNSASFYEAVLARETLSPTAFVTGWALPHARLKELADLCFAFGRAAQPVRWFGSSGTKVTIIFLFAVPERETRAYLNLIAAVARLSQNVGLKADLQSAPDSQALLGVLRQVPLPKLVPPPAAYMPLGANH